MPEILREAMSSEINSDIVWKTGENEHLPEDKITTVSRIVGYALMGFIHPEDLAREINENLGIDIRIAASIADPLNKKIFQPLREELEKIYSPALSGAEAPAEEESEQTGSTQPVLMDSINSPRVDSISPPQVEKAIKPVSVSPVPKFFQTGQIPKPAAPPPAPVPKPVAQSVPTAPTAAMPSAAPFMLHMESKSQPLSPSKSDFKIGLSEEQFGKMEQKWSAPPRPAQIETGFTPQSKTEMPKPDARVVHYSEMKTPIAPMPKDKNLLPPQVMPKKIGVSTSSQIQSAIIKTVPLPPVPPAPKPPAASKTGVPVPPLPQKPAIAQAPPQKPTEPPKPMVRQSSPQEEMLPGKPEEKELPPPQK